MQIFNVSKKQLLCDQCRLASTFLQRLVGLLNRNTLRHGEGLLLDNCHGIHTVGMRFQIDVLFLDKDLHVMRTVQRLRPFHVGPVVNDAVYVLELAAGVIEETHTDVGDQIQFRTGSEAAIPAPQSDGGPSPLPALGSNCSR